MLKTDNFPGNLVAVLFNFATLISAPAQLLYDGALGTSPANQGWFSLNFGATQSLTNGGVLLDSYASNSAQAGYSLTTAPLKRTEGFAVRFTSQLVAEGHANNNRAGLSVIVLADDHRGIELAFWTNTIFAQSDSPLFTHAEETNVSTTAIVDYTLTLHSLNYELSANGTQILTGAVRDYSSFSGFPNPYSSSNFLFFGDDSGSAGGAMLLKKVALITAPQLLAHSDGLITWTGVSNLTYSVLTSSNLLQWDLAGTANSATEHFAFTNTTPTATRFIRVAFP